MEIAIIAGTLALYIGLRVGLQWWLTPRDTVAALTADELRPADSARRLVVMVHGLAGRQSFEGAVQLARSALPGTDVLAVDYDCRWFANTNPAVVADVLEREVHRVVTANDYREVAMVGHSAGGAILRKTFVWGHGAEEDRERFGRQGKRGWVDRVNRIVLLAGINRGWSIEPKPAAMSLSTYLAIWAALRAGRLFGIGRFATSVYRGQSFIANTRVQWLRIARSDAVVNGSQPFPTVIQLVGSEDDVVSREDSLDLVASRGTLFKTLQQTDHRDIALSLNPLRGAAHEARVRFIQAALTGDLKTLDPDQREFPPEFRDVKRLFYVMHGIRDYGFWTDVVRRQIEEVCKAQCVEARVVNHKYGFVPMLPFIIYRDRQSNVRRFMDEYTENLARYPNAHDVDYAGHSNGTYILASALVHYRTLRVRRVFFAGSVVPKHYPWTQLIDANRVGQVVNVVATADWVVALFPKLFEQIADWRGIRPVKGCLDIGAGGFRGFLDAGNALGKVINLNFATGKHSTGVDVRDAEKLEAITSFMVDGDMTKLARYRDAGKQNAALDVASNVSYLVWIGLAAVFGGVGWAIGVFVGGAWLAVYGVLLLMLLHSI